MKMDMLLLQMLLMLLLLLELLLEPLEICMPNGQLHSCRAVQFRPTEASINMKINVNLAVMHRVISDYMIQIFKIISVRNICITVTTMVITLYAL